MAKNCKIEFIRPYVPIFAYSVSSYSLGNKNLRFDNSRRHLLDATNLSLIRLLHMNPVTVMLVLTLLAYGCPVQAIVKAFGLDERTVRDWQQRAGRHCQQVHEHLVENSQYDLWLIQYKQDSLQIMFVLYFSQRLFKE